MFFGAIYLFLQKLKNLRSFTVNNLFFYYYFYIIRYLGIPILLIFVTFIFLSLMYFISLLKEESN